MTLTQPFKGARFRAWTVRDIHQTVEAAWGILWHMVCAYATCSSQSGHDSTSLQSSMALRHQLPVALVVLEPGKQHTSLDLSLLPHLRP